MKKFISIFFVLLVCVSCRDRYDASKSHVSNNPISPLYPNMSISIRGNSMEYGDVVASIMKDDLTRNVINYNIGKLQGNVSVVVDNISTKRNWMWLGLGWIDAYAHTLWGVPFYLQDVTIDVSIEIYNSTELIQRFPYSETITRYVGLYYSQDLPSAIAEATQNILPRIHRDFSNNYCDVISYFGNQKPTIQNPASIQVISEPQDETTPISSNSYANAEEDVMAAEQKSGVDINIPHTGIVNNNTFVVIFANEDYRRVVSVPYAKNDGKVFNDYCRYTLGIPAKNIHIVENATLNDMRHEISWLSQICEAYGSEASVIIYYAGHGVPDEKDKDAYLLPVDGAATDIKSGYKLDEFISEASKMGAKMVSIFLDACFSGSKREDGMLVNARGVAYKPKPCQPQGNVILFSAAKGDETAYPINEEEHGMFTYYLLKKLQESKGEVTLLELSNYITKNVHKKSIVENTKSQTPTTIASEQLGDSWKQMTLIPIKKRTETQDRITKAQKKQKK